MKIIWINDILSSDKAVAIALAAAAHASMLFRAWWRWLQKKRSPAVAD